MIDNSPISFRALYLGDVVSNFSGGIKKGSCYIGLANIKVSFAIEKAHLWKADQFFINAANAHGGNPSATLVGDFHTISNFQYIINPARTEWNLNNASVGIIRFGFNF